MADERIICPLRKKVGGEVLPGRRRCSCGQSGSRWSAATIFFIRYTSRNIPFFEEFGLVPAVTGHEPVTVSWAWQQSNEHRLFLPRLILVGLMRYVVDGFPRGPVRQRGPWWRRRAP